MQVSAVPLQQFGPLAKVELNECHTLVYPNTGSVIVVCDQKEFFLKYSV